ncbi:hypothetical protein O181_004298 [Austropuccinia psidii MF-1]|uniref:Uncharacterized protein n=1 Tax=Austropuccinia psidii MF-1 TaxID=1389203 RepID=A0A9Q3BG31_9BASI|nr:hypothetical protein [Austropuccinia psidii MF-1]
MSALKTVVPKDPVSEDDEKISFQEDLISLTHFLTQKINPLSLAGLSGYHSQQPLPPPPFQSHSLSKTNSSSPHTILPTMDQPYFLIVPATTTGWTPSIPSYYTSLNLAHQ